MNILREKTCYNALLLVFRDGKYSAQALTEALDLSCGEDDEFITRLFYGVLERNITLEYIIGRLVDKKPKLSVSVILKMGLYMIRYMNVANYAVVDKCVELAKILGKGGAGGFINAVLRRSDTVILPAEGDCGNIDFISVNCGLPKWLTGMLIKEYGLSFIRDLTSFEEFRTHIRINDSIVDTLEFEKNLSRIQDLKASKTKYGYYVTHNTLKTLFKTGQLSENACAVQSLASMSAVQCYASGLNGDCEVLDLCAAPGGKAVYLYQLTKSKITACDVHLHRLELIKKYSGKMGASLNIVLNDACVEKEEWLNRFDCVVCDVPCSGTGDIRSKPDVMLNRKFTDIAELSKLQMKILSQSAKYVKIGGKLCYSTCSILHQENESVVNEFLNRNPCFTLEDCSRFAPESLFKGGDGQELGHVGSKILSDKNGAFLKLFPHVHATDGFFVAVMRKNA